MSDLRHEAVVQQAIGVGSLHVVPHQGLPGRLKQNVDRTSQEELDC